MNPAPGEKLWATVRFVLPFSLIMLLMGMHYRLDGFLLERMHGAYEAGIYASAYRLLDAANMVGALAAFFLVPYLARHQLKKEAMGNALLQARVVLLLFAGAIVAFFAFYSPWVQQLFYHHADRYQSTVIRLCMFSLPGYCLVHLYSSVLTATRRFRSFILVLVLSVVVNGAVNIVLIPYLGAYACCVAAIASQYTCGIACTLVVSRSLRLPFHLPSFLACVAATAGALLFFWTAHRSGWNPWWVLALAAGLSLLIVLTRISYFKKYLISLRN
jgi:O-antigen/teichoic acid export membrane protein